MSCKKDELDLSQQMYISARKAGSDNRTNELQRLKYAT